ncbi:predicted nucleoside-diphosphate-sugar epimerase [Agrilactobacillus composti DSM 18527 = JCM 14202]|uniref:SDR family oxidoreductase n=1 Tax=Agrilactobacillus composti TaxID=398555 RepID=UPI00042E03D2|nr:SDR family oxidoreductase [Agrilactobacillus composti]GAF40592.1 predicted nucleoside-diphosphate-sugar epimerase [Agrilactobacillus composti DSM 18527 = JCM 14202]
MKQILVIGGTGNIGFPLIKTLMQQADVEVVAGAHHLAQDTTTLLAKLGYLDIRRFDFLDPTTFPGALKGIDKIFFVRPPQLGKPKTDMRPFLTYAKTQNIKQIVFVSLLGVDKNSMTPHHKIEKIIAKLGLPYTFIRPSFFMQNLSSTHLKDIQQHHDLFIPGGQAKTSFIDTRDIGAVAAAALTQPKYMGQKIDITGPAALTYDQVAAIMTRILGEKITYSQPSLLKFRRTVIQRGTPKAFANVMTMLYFITQMGNANEVNGNVVAILGREPIKFETFVQDYRGVFLGKKASY